MWRIAGGIMLAMIFTSPAHADRIDGGWCSEEGLRIEIEGPKITTSSKATITGNYGRHTFAYVAPSGDPDAGAEVFLEQLSEETMNTYRTVDGKTSGPELWRRCVETS